MHELPLEEYLLRELELKTALDSQPTFIDGFYKGAKLALVVALCFLIGCTIGLVNKAGKTLDGLRETSKATTALVQDTNKRLTLTLTNVDRLVIIAGATAREAHLASTEERKYLASMNAQVTRDLTTANTTLEAATKTLNETSESVAAVRPVLTGLQPTLDQLTEASAGLNKFVNDPNIPKTVANVESTTSSMKDVATDAKKVADEYTKPKRWFQKGWTAILEAAYYAKQLL